MFSSRSSQRSRINQEKEKEKEKQRRFGAEAVCRNLLLCILFPRNHLVAQYLRYVSASVVLGGKRLVRGQRFVGRDITREETRTSAVLQLNFYCRKREAATHATTSTTTQPRTKPRATRPEEWQGGRERERETPSSYRPKSQRVSEAARTYLSSSLFLV